MPELPEHIKAVPPPPKGCSVTQRGVFTMLTASCRDTVQALQVALFLLLWWSFSLCFSYSGLAAIYTDWHGPLPGWLPEPVHMEGLTGTTVTVADALKFAAFMLLFDILAPACLLAATLFKLRGVARVTIGDSAASIFSGIGRFGITRVVDLCEVREVRVEVNQSKEDKSSSHWIIIEAGKRMYFGQFVAEIDQHWLAAAMMHFVSRCRAETADSARDGSIMAAQR